MDDQKLWNIINSHFKDNHQRLVMHHIDSYNDFFENKIYDIFREENPISIVSVYDEKNDSYRNNCDLYLGGKNGKKIYFENRFYMIMMKVNTCILMIHV